MEKRRANDSGLRALLNHPLADLAKWLFGVLLAVAVWVGGQVLTDIRDSIATIGARQEADHVTIGSQTTELAKQSTLQAALMDRMNREAEWNRQGLLQTQQQIDSLRVDLRAFGRPQRASGQ